jgi:hypothetical protein
VASVTTVILLSVIKSHESFKNICIVDNGAFYQYCNSNEGLLDQATISEMITLGHTLKAEQVRKLRSCVLQCDVIIFEIKLDVNFVVELWINIFRINKALMNGFMIGNEGVLIKLTKVETKLMLD